jgi:hypothetical protein
MSIFASEYDPNCEPEPACMEPSCNDLLEQDLLGDWYCPSCEAKRKEADDRA